MTEMECANMAEWGDARPIETDYKGCRFRSRLEARWAVFFDALDIEWDYEPEGFELDGTRYLPDFWLPGIDIWVEVKGSILSGRDEEKVKQLALKTKKPCLVLLGSPSLEAQIRAASGVLFYDAWNPIDGRIVASAYTAGESPERDVCIADCVRFCECLTCGGIGIAQGGRLGRLHPDCHMSVIFEFPQWVAPDTDKLIGAYRAALSARFEYGETPK